MTITQADAAEALRLAGEAEARSHTLRGYQSSAPHLILWGGIYAAGYLVSQFAPERAGTAWLGLVIAGSAGSAGLAQFDKSKAQSHGINWAILLGLFATFLALITATVLIMRPSDPRQMAAFIPIVVAAGYIVLGVGVGARLVVAGVALGALTLIGYFAFPAWFFLWMAVLGGCTLIGSGLWLRRA